MLQAAPPKETKRKYLVILLKDHGLSFLIVPKIPSLLKKKSKATNLERVKMLNAGRCFFFFLIKRKRKKRRRRSAVSEQLSRKGFSGAGRSHYGPQPGWRWPATGTF